MRPQRKISLLFLILGYSWCQPEDWFRSKGTPTFSCEDVGENVTSYSWFHVLYGYLVFPIVSSNKYYSLSNATLSLPRNFSDDRDIFCEAKSKDGRVWRSRKAQLRFGLGPPASTPAPLRVEALDTPVVQRLFDGDSCHLACSFPKTSRASWIHNGRLVNNDVVLRADKPGKSILYIIRFNVTRHSGVYQCLVNSTGDSWRPLRRPFLVAPAHINESKPDLPFFHYDIVTVGELAMNEENDHAPRIMAIKGSRFKVSVTNDDKNLTLTSVVVSDQDRGQAGQLNCSVAYSSDDGSKVLFIRTSSADLSPLVGKLALEATDRSKMNSTAYPIRFNLTCSDKGKQKKTAKKSFEVELDQSSAVTSTESPITRELAAMANERLKDKPENETLVFMKKLTNVMKNASKLSAADVALAGAKTAEMIEVIDRSKTHRSDMLKEVTVLVSNTLKADKEALSNGEVRGGVASQMLSSVGKLLGAIQATAGGREFQSERLAVGAVALNDNSKQSGREIAFSSSSRQPSDASISNVTEGSVAISVLAAHVLGSRVEFAMFGDAALFEAMRPQNRTRVLSPVISARAVLKRWEQQKAVRLVFSGDNLPGELKESAARFCAFWNETTRSWDTTGCNSSLVGRVTKCSCSHLTNFALLLDLDALPIERPHHLALSFLSYMCLTLSCIAMALTMGVYFTYMRRKQASSRSGQKSGASAVTRCRILLALSGSLFIAHFFFLISASHSHAGSTCKAIALLLHFFYLSVFFWSVVEGLNVFLSLIYMALRSGRIVTHLSSFFPKAAAVVWGLATLVVIVTAGSTRLAGYGPLYEGVDDASDMSLCFLPNGLSFFLGFVLPLVLCLCANLVILALLGFVLMRRAGGMSAKQKSRSKNKVIGFFSVCFTLNMTWAVGLLQFWHGKVVMNYLFVIGNGLQGVLIFVFYCVLREEMRSHMAKSIWCLSWMRRAGDDSGASTSMPLTSTSSGRKTSSTSLVSRRKKSTTGSSKMEAEAKRNY